MKKKILYAAVIVALLTACEGEESDPLTASLSLNSVSIDGTALTSGSIGLFVGSDNGYTAQNNTKYTFGNPWSSDNPVTLTSKAPLLCAYYPYTAALSNATAVSLTSQQYSAAADFCYTSTGSGLSATSNALALSLSHAYAQITLNIGRSTTYSDTCAVSGVSFSNAGLNASATLNLFTGSSQSSVGTVAFNPQITGIQSGKTTTVVALLVPVTTAMTGNLVITLTVDGAQLTTNVDVTDSGLATLEAGKNYQGTLTVQGQTNTSALSVKRWAVNDL
jgi:hypothetical protein